MYRTLIVDDDRAIRYELKKSAAFKRNGFSIACEASDGKDALDKVLTEHFDIALVDVRMPRINGIQFIQELKTAKNKLCIAIISGSGEFCYTRKAIQLGAFDYLLKPLNERELDDLLSRAAEFLDRMQQNKDAEEKTQKQLVESLKLPYSQHDEQKLYQLLFKDPDSCMVFAKDLCCRLSDFYERDPFKTSVILDNSLKSLTRRLLSEMPWLGNFDFLGQDHYLQRLDHLPTLINAFLAEIEKLSCMIKKLHINTSNSVVKLICEYILQNIGSKITLETVAEALNYSSKYLGKLFRDATNESIVDYMTKIKMEKAKMLILSGKYKSYEVSELLGYKNTDYFSKLFREHHGTAPLKCRKSAN